MAGSLERRYGGTWQAINVLSAAPNAFYQDDPFIILNERLGDDANDVIDLQEYEDLNVEFLRSDEVAKIVDEIAPRQPIVPVYSFTSSFFDDTDDRFTMLGPASAIATKYDSKAAHYRLFHELGVSPVPGEILSAVQIDERINQLAPCFVSSSFTSGGNESAYVYTPEDWRSFKKGLRDVNREAPFVVTKLLDLALELNINAIVIDENRTVPLVITDQLMRGKRYLGNVYPTSASSEQIEQILHITKTIGDHLSREGFRGTFGCDFLVDKNDNLYTVDLNPRRQGGYVCNLLALEAVGINLTDHELDCAIDDHTLFGKTFAQIQYPHVWAHSKIKPDKHGFVLKDAWHEGGLSGAFDHPSSTYKSLFYKKGMRFEDGYVGYAVVTGGDRRETTDRLQNILDNVIY